jgi:hypothetical protein
LIAKMTAPLRLNLSPRPLTFETAWRVILPLGHAASHKSRLHG